MWPNTRRNQIGMYGPSSRNYMQANVSSGFFPTAAVANGPHPPHPALNMDYYRQNAPPQMNPQIFYQPPVQMINAPPPIHNPQHYGFQQQGALAANMSNPFRKAYMASHTASNSVIQSNLPGPSGDRQRCHNNNFNVQVNNSWANYNESGNIGDGIQNNSYQTYNAPIITNGREGISAQKSNSLEGFPRAEQTLKNLIRLSLKSCEVGEKIATNHRFRPCFKKIDSLCSRVRQDVLRSGTVMPNINSQGIAWPLKDHIFSMARILNGWCILKGYIYDNSPGLNKIKEALDPEFESVFFEWQEHTCNLIEKLVSSISGLETLLQNNKNGYREQLKPGDSNSPRKVEIQADLLCKEMKDKGLCSDSEASIHETFKEGQYIRTGKYCTTKTDIDSPDSNGVEQPEELDEIVELSFENIRNFIDLGIPNSKESKQKMEEQNEDHIYGTLPQVDLSLNKYFTHDERIKLRARGDTSILPQHSAEEQESPKYEEVWDRFEPRGNPIEKYGVMMPLKAIPEPEVLPEYFETIVSSLLSLDSISKFFKKQFGQNYFPGFYGCYGDQFSDIRTIILKCQTQAYGNVYEVVHELRKIIYLGNAYCMKISDADLSNYLRNMEANFDKIFSLPVFESYNFDHITGAPNDILREISVNSKKQNCLSKTDEGITADASNASIHQLVKNYEQTLETKPDIQVENTKKSESVKNYFGRFIQKNNPPT